MRPKPITWIGLALLALALTAPHAANAQRQPEAPPDTRLVQINLLAASKTGDSDLSDLPVNTRKAIEDIKDFLPFKGYRILDTSLVRALAQDPKRGSRPAKTFMTGPGGTKLQVEFRMVAEEGSSEIFVQSFEVGPDIMTRFRPVPVNPDESAAADSGAPAIAPRADLVDMGALISTAFTAHLGQTVVVGSSRLNGGDEALIVLFTALP